MDKKIKIAIIGLDTSHSVAFPGLMHDPETPAEFRVSNMEVTRCLRFDTPFQNTEGLDKRQARLESLGIEVVTDFDRAVENCDAIMLEINDPAFHLEYFKKCAVLGKPVFLDKPIAANLAEAREIYALAEKHNVRFFTASALRFDIDFTETLEQPLDVQSAVVWGPVGRAAAGSSIVWYGVHTFEMLERIMGRGAESVTVVNDGKGHICTVAYADGRRGIVELTRGAGRYGAVMRDDKANEVMVRVTGRVPYYQRLMVQVEKFFRGESCGVPLDESMEIMMMLEAADISSATGKTVFLKDL